jgi:hypothetical protein
VIPPDTPDLEWDRAAFAGAFAIDFLSEVHKAEQFQSVKTDIYDKIVSLADWTLTQQCTDDAKNAYGGFKSNETSNYYYSVDACRVIPALLNAYELTQTAAHLEAAKLAANTFLYSMQHKPSELGIHDTYYGGFARAVTIADAWLHQMDIENLYGLPALKMLCEHDADNKSLYESMMADLRGFVASGFEQRVN